MRVVYDISVLGAGLYSLPARTGVARFIDNLRSALVSEDEIELSYCAFHSLEKYLQLRINSDAIAGLDCANLCPPGNQLAKIAETMIGRVYPKASASETRPLRRHTLGGLLHAINVLFGNCDLVDMAGKDIFHSTFYPFPKAVMQPGHFKRFITIHDLIPIMCPQFFGFEKNHLAHRIVNSVGPEDWVVTNSEATKGDLCNHAQVDPFRVFVTPLAASKIFYHCTDAKRLSSVREQYKIPNEPYILSVATLEPRKNIDQVIRSFVDFVHEEHVENLNLVLVGTPGWSFGKIFDEIGHASTLKRRIIVTGYVHDDDLTALYSGAMMFVYPSFYEGFGLPPLEAMQCGVPVITSNTSSLPEVVGNAGIMVDPTDGAALSQAMLDIFSQPSLRESLSGKSLERASHFSWKKCAELTVEAYRTAMRS